MFCDLLTTLAFERHWYVLVHFPCFVWVSDASSVTPDHDRVQYFQCWWPSIVYFGRGQQDARSTIFPSAVLMLQEHQHYRVLRT